MHIGACIVCVCVCVYKCVCVCVCVYKCVCVCVCVCVCKAVMKCHRLLSIDSRSTMSDSMQRLYWSAFSPSIRWCCIQSDGTILSEWRLVTVHVRSLHYHHRVSPTHAYDIRCITLYLLAIVFQLWLLNSLQEVMPLVT